jgi:hypothetical protein
MCNASSSRRIESVNVYVLPVPIVERLVSSYRTLDTQK